MEKRPIENSTLDLNRKKASKFDQIGAKNLTTEATSSHLTASRWKIAPLSQLLDISWNHIASQ
jgi:hypothetical protein